ncbi:porin family protein [Alcanivorax sp. JB21]|uniref:porin family protein n=1 Tax=Alcanivorax limicola TaxID=2874102 RepID=UPI001CBD0F65|nr:porin family protein [Alcanivorax limicola]MBZ2188216.1 porin family protein [Alcanivorax limicola]
MRRILCGVVAAGACGLALADMSPYAGIQYGYTDFERGNVSTSLDVLVVRGGMRFTELLSAEARVSTGIGSGSDSGVKVENRYNYGAYGVVTLPLGNEFTPYAMGGYTYARSEIGGNRERDDGASYGAGVDWALDDMMSLNLEVLRTVRNDFTKQTVVGLGVKYHF